MKLTIGASIIVAIALTIMAGLALAQPDGPAGHDVAATIRIERPWSRATPAAASVAGGYVTLTNTGREPDRLIGGSFTRAKSVEVHMMTNDMGVMKMRHMTEGVALPPGVPVELKPGGLHLMLMGLHGGLTSGETVAGTLVFEKAGALPVTFTIAPMGAEAPPASDSHEHHRH